jgi:hypothetical protein
MLRLLSPLAKGESPAADALRESLSVEPRGQGLVYLEVRVATPYGAEIQLELAPESLRFHRVVRATWSELGDTCLEVSRPAAAKQDHVIGTIQAHRPVFRVPRALRGSLWACPPSTGQSTADATALPLVKWELEISLRIPRHVNTHSGVA